MPKTSIVMATYNRPAQLTATLLGILKQNFQDKEIVIVDDGDDVHTPQICLGLAKNEYPVRYVKLNRPQGGYKNQAYPLNVGIRHAEGEIVIIQNPECMHMTDELTAKLTSEVKDYNAVFCRTLALTQTGEPEQWYCHRDCNARPFFFCGGIKKSWFEKIRGYDEDFTGYGYEDDDIAYRLKDSGVQFEYSDLEVWHQWHPSSSNNIDSTIYDRKRTEYLTGKIGVIRNLNREWGEV